MTDRELLQQALYALEDIAEAGSDAWGRSRPCIEDAYGLIDALRARLAQEERSDDVQPEERSSDIELEPVAWRTFDGEGGYDYRTYENNENYALEWAKRNSNHLNFVAPLYTAPQPAAQPLAYCAECAMQKQYMALGESHEPN